MSTAGASWYAADDPAGKLEPLREHIAALEAENVALRAVATAARAMYPQGYADLMAWASGDDADCWFCEGPVEEDIHDPDCPAVLMRLALTALDAPADVTLSAEPEYPE